MSTQKMTLDDLRIHHPYYCHTGNFYSNKPSKRWKDWASFYNEYKDADVDMNLIFRWDVKRHDDDTYYMEIFIMRQRKGIFAPQVIEVVTEANVDQIVEVLTRHAETIKAIWNPIIKP